METISSQPENKPKTSLGVNGRVKANVGRVLVSLFVPLLALIALYMGFIFLRDTTLPQGLMVIFAIIWGVGGVALSYWVSNLVVEQLSKEWTMRLQPFVFVGPALFLLAWYLAIPTVRTFRLSFMDANSFNYVGIANYVFAFTDRIMLEAFRNNLLWLVFGTSFSVGFGLLIAVLADRTRFESLYKSLIFMPMAISFVGAGVIWKFMYAYVGTGTGMPQIGLLNAILVSLGGTPQPWLQISPWNNFFLIAIMVWMQTGYAMVIISSAIKDVPAELLEAARIDGANEVQAFTNITVPYINFLIFLSLLPGLFLAIYSLFSKTHYELFIVFIIGICTLSMSWFGVERLILRRVKKLIALSKRLAASDLSARSGQTIPVDELGELTQAFDQMAASLESQTRQIQTRANQLAVISELASEIAIERNISVLLELVLEKVMKLLDTSQAALTLYDPAAGDLVITAAKGLNMPTGIRIKMGEGSIGRAALNRQPVIIDNHVHWKGRDTGFQVDPDSTVIQIPMAYRGDLIGVLGVVVSTEAFHNNQESMHLLNLFAEQAASAIKNARLFEDTHNRLQMMETINAISTSLRVAQNVDDILPVLLEKTTAIVNAIMGSIWLYDPAHNILRKVVSSGVPIEETQIDPNVGIVGRVFSTGQPEYAPNWIEEFTYNVASSSRQSSRNSAALIPIRTTHAVVGVLVLGFQSPFLLTADQKQMMTTIAEMAGNAIHRMHLHEQTIGQLKRLDALHQIDLAITSSLDLRYTLQILLDQVISQLGVDAACALTFNAHEHTLEYAASKGFTTNALHNTHLPIGQGYAGLAAKEQRTIFIPDLNNRTTDYLRSPSFSAEGFVTYYAVPLIVRSQIKGVLEVFHRSRLVNDREWLDFLEALASQAAIAIENASLYREMQQSNLELNLAYNATLEGWSRALDLRDEDTEGHTQRVTEISMKLARAIGISEADIVYLRWGALLHDIGKLGVPDPILLKPGPLTDQEWTIMRLHPTYAYNLLSPIAYLAPALDIPYCHHEKWDGSGYPRGLKGVEIPLSARIFSVVDVWDALRSGRPYRKGWPEDQVLAYLRNQAGLHFDPKVIEAFLSMVSAEEIKRGTE